MIGVRIAGYDDIGAMSKVLAASWKSAYRGIVQSDYLEQLPYTHWVDFLVGGLQSGSVFAMVLEEDDIFGAAILSPAAAGQVNLLSLYLLPDRIGKGFGHTFYAAIEAELKARGFSKCTLDVLEDNKKAIRFYEAHGFINTKTTVKTVLGDCEYVCKIYAKRIS